MFRLIRVAILVGFLVCCGYKTYTWYQARELSPSAQREPAPRIDSRPNHLQPTASQAVSMLRSIASGVLEVAGIEGSPAPVSGGGVSAVYYSPWQNLEEIDYNAIVSSRCNHLDIAIYSFTDWKLAQAAVICARSGRLVRIYRDYEQYEQEQKRGLQVAHMLKRPNISVRLKSSTVLMHMKAWSDGCILREGSANWSPSGEKQQDNSLAFINDRASVASFERAFEAMWIRNSNIIIQ